MVETSVIGCGNMGGALIKGLARTDEHTVTGYDIDPDVLEEIAEFCARTTDDLGVVAEADVVIIAVKPDIVPLVLEDLELSPDQTLVSFAAGVSTDVLEAKTEAAVARVMPNLAASTGNMAAAVTGEGVTDEVRAILATAGEFVEVEEAQMDIATAVNGSGPAFVFYFIEAMAQAGVEGGLTPEQARTLAAQTFKGAAETVLRSEESLEDLINAVCSPNGTTIEGMELLWDRDVATDIEAAVGAAERRSAELARDAIDE